MSGLFQAEVVFAPPLSHIPPLDNCPMRSLNVFFLFGSVAGGFLRFVKKEGQGQQFERFFFYQIVAEVMEKQCAETISNKIYIFFY